MDFNSRITCNTMYLDEDENLIFSGDCYSGEVKEEERMRQNINTSITEDARKIQID